ncbi:MAG TPA: hypothetical protein ENF75_02750 [Acidilobales archaeon]|nr:hypothetical protein [Acidilobales archaeon]
MSESSESEKREERKIDIKALVAVIPPASQVLGRHQKKTIPERRIRIRLSEDVERDKAKINPSLAKELGIKDKLVIVVAGRKRFVFNSVLDDSVKVNEAYVNAELMRDNGIADNSIATIRRVGS